jgi:hypothetical protein
MGMGSKSYKDHITLRGQRIIRIKAEKNRESEAAEDVRARIVLLGPNRTLHSYANIINWVGGSVPMGKQFQQSFTACLPTRVLELKEVVI